MPRAKTTKIDFDGQTYLFVTRGNEFSDDEIMKYFKNKQHERAPTNHIRGVMQEPERPKFSVPDTLKQIFQTDLRFGLEFCAAKYGASKEDIIEEAKRLAPGTDIKVFDK